MVWHKLSISRTHDMCLVKKLWSDPRIYFDMCDQDCPPPEKWQPIDSPQRYFLVPSLPSQSGSDLTPLGVIAFYQLSSALAEIHVGILPQFQHQCTPEIINKSCEWIFNNTSIIKILGFIAINKKNVLKLSQKCGFEQEGYLKNSFIANNEIVDQIIMTRGK